MKERLQRLDAFQRRHPWLAFPLAVQKKFGEDGGGDLAGLIAFYGFFSLFPLLLVFVTVLGFVFQHNPSAQHDIVNSALKEFPIVGDQIQAGTLHGSSFALAIGIIGALITGLGVTVAAQKAFDRVYAVPHRERANWFKARLRGLEVLGVVGVLQIVSTGVSGLVSGGLGGVGTALAGIAASLLLNILMFFAAFRMLTERSVPTKELWTGILVAATAWEVLQQVGGIYINHVVKGGSQTYGTFATVLGLLTWLFLGARVLVYAAEVNVVRCRRLWPRSLTEPPVPADHKAHDAMAKIEERSDEEEVEVTRSNGSADRDTVRGR
jgi:YihY family inner membrane protein